MTNNVEWFSLHTRQFAYQKGKPTYLTLHSLGILLEKILDGKEIACYYFLDYKGAFNSTCYQAIEMSSRRKYIKTQVKPCEWWKKSIF